MARSTKNQEWWLQKETAPGVATETAMKRYGSLKGMPGYNSTSENFTAQGSRVVNGIIRNNELGSMSVQGIQDYNALHLALDSLFGFATPTTPGGGTNSKQRIWNVAGSGVVTPATYTSIWGDTTQALKQLHFLFNSLQLTINRGQLSMAVSALARMATTGATKPTQGVTHKFVAAQPIAARNYGIWFDPTWAALGTTRALAAYDGGINFGERWVPDWPINDLLPSFESVVEAEEVEHSSNLSLGFDAAAVTHVGEWLANAIKFLRFKTVGPIIEGAIPYSLQIDMALLIVSPGEMGSAPSSPTVVLPFSYVMTEDPVSNNVCQITLVNNVP